MNPSRMDRLKADRRITVAAASVVIVLVGGLLFWLLRPRGDNEVPVVEVTPQVRVDDEEPQLREYQLYFPGADGRLHARARELPLAADPTANVTLLVEALLAGPHGEYERAASEPQDGEDASENPGDENPDATAGDPAADSEDVAEPAPPLPALEDLNPADGLWPPFPPTVTLGQTFVLDDETVILDLVSADGQVPAMGSRAEILMLFSLVNTVVLNFEEAERLVVLWNGQQPSTFGGHFDTTRPLRPDPDLIASDGAP